VETEWDTLTVFAYPRAARSRRHGPCGYAHYSLYKPWLRDEFQFRCVYCDGSIRALTVTGRDLIGVCQLDRPTLRSRPCSKRPGAPPPARSTRS
jgi:hypothetical protein